MAYPTIWARGAQRLRGVNRNIGAEGSSEGENRCPANGEPKYQQHQARRSEPVRPAEHGVRMHIAVPHSPPARGEHDRKQDHQRPAIFDLASASAGGRDQLKQKLGANPHPEQIPKQPWYCHASLSPGSFAAARAAILSDSCYETGGAIVPMRGPPRFRKYES